MSYCTGCGQPRGGPAPFCTICGTPFGGPPPTEEESFGSWFRPEPAPAGPDQTQRIPVFPAPGGFEPGRPPGPQRPGVTSRRIVVALAALVLLAAGVTGAWLTLRHPHAAVAPPGAAGRTRTALRPPPSTSPATATPARPPAAGRASGLVAVAPGVSRQAAEPRVVAFLNDYFTAINQHDYQRYSVLLGPRVRQVETAPVFHAGYQTTTDSAVTLTGITVAGAGGLAAGVTFTSHQAPADTPSRSGCTAWRITLVLAPQRGGLVLEPPPPGYHASFRAC